jgi:hypothetical protein
VPSPVSSLSSPTLKRPAAELVDVGVTNNGYRPGGVDRAMQAWIRSQPAGEIGASLHGRFQGSYDQGSSITPSTPPGPRSLV